MSHDEIIERTGGSGGRFQIISYVMCLILFSTEAFLIYNLAFLNLVPFYNCYDAKGISRECS